MTEITKDFEAYSTLISFDFFDIKNSSEKIIQGINLLRLGNNPIKIDGKDIYKIISN